MTETNLGATGETVAANVRRRRVELGLSYAKLSRVLVYGGRDIAPLALRRIEDGTRRVDADDLAALAIALDISPITLLMPHNVESEQPVAVSGSRTRIPAKRVWTWLNASYPLNGAVMGFYSATLPAWERESLETKLGVR